uniref:Photosystem I assembly protein Ycf4 n=1 Tax=Neonotonia wightii TaxID=103823 RepID=C0J3F4_9FABA|nr:Ycf4 [Neonotonia wightii]
MGLEFRSKDMLVYSMTETRRETNIFWAFIIFLGSLGLFLVGISSYLVNDLVIFSEEIRSDFPFLPDLIYFPFNPQGATMAFYGIAGLCISFYLWVLILWDVGGGYDIFNKKDKNIRFIRRGFPGKNRSIILDIPMNETISVRIITAVKERGIFTRTLTYESIIYLETINHGFIPLTRLEDNLTGLEITNKAGEISLFLNRRLYY